ncbi:cobalamin biosynthesis protein [Azospirillum sp. ST 5-10]|uniref:cobalamin biosynthesis protein n=1 Tax=unclassified Azospirillum TaxID=2630922 RepID=UPI003F4A7042
MRRTVIAAGLGCRRGCDGREIAGLVRTAFAAAGLDDGARAATVLFAPDAKRDEPGLADAARRLALPLRFLPRDALAAVAGRTVTRSARVAAAVGLPSVAEAAALAGAGPGGRLLLPRLSTPRATCALAVPETPP